MEALRLSRNTFEEKAMEIGYHILTTNGKPVRFWLGAHSHLLIIPMKVDRVYEENPFNEYCIYTRDRYLETINADYSTIPNIPVGIDTTRVIIFHYTENMVLNHNNVFIWLLGAAIYEAFILSLLDNDQYFPSFPSMNVINWLRRMYYHNQSLPYDNISEWMASEQYDLKKYREYELAINKYNMILRYEVGINRDEAINTNPLYNAICGTDNNGQQLNYPRIPGGMYIGVLYMACIVTFAENKWTSDTLDKIPVILDDNVFKRYVSNKYRSEFYNEPKYRNIYDMADKMYKTLREILVVMFRYACDPSFLKDEDGNLKSQFIKD